MSNVTPATTDYSRQREMTMNPLRAVPSSPADNTPVDEVTNYEILPQQLLKSLLQGTAISLFLAIVLFFIRGSFTLKDMAIALIYWAVIIGGYSLLRLDKLVWLSHGFIAFFWLSLTIFMIFYGSDRMPNPGAYTVVILICVVLLRGRVATVYTVISIISGVLIGAAARLGYIPLFVLNRDEPIYIMGTMPQAFIVFSLFAITYHSVRFTLKTLRFNEQDLQRIRQTLGQRTLDLSVTNNQLLQEIGERQKAETKLEQQRAFLREIIDTIPNYVFVKDADGRFLLTNKAMAAAYHGTPEEMEGHTGRKFNPHTEQMARFEAGDRAVLASQKEMSWPELPFTDLDGNFHWLHVVKRPLYDPATGIIAVLGITNDMTQIKATTEALREKEENFRTLVEASFEGIIICIDHIIQEANANFAAMFGYTAVSEVLGKSISEFLEPDDAHYLRAKVAEQGKINMETIGIRQDNSTFPLEVVSHTINYQGKLAQITGYRDITMRKQAEEAEQHANKLESLRIMAGGLAHDFNNLLVAMMTQIAIAKNKINDEHACQNNLDKAIQATETAAMLTRQLLAYTGQGHFEVTKINLNELINQNLRLFQDALPANIAFQINLQEPLPNILADGVQIQQIIMNLLLNAAEALGTKPGTITVTTTPYQLKESNLSHWQPNNEAICPGNFVLLEVADTGRGMDEATVSRIFDPFFSTKGTGRGLGLAAVLGIVRGHKGSIRASSKLGQGTLFQFLFPTEEWAAAAENTAVPAPPTQKNLVLVIDDEERVLEALSDILELKQIPALLAASGEEGIALYNERYQEIGLIILDLSMPRISGIDVFHTLRSINPEAKIILSSGYTEGEILQKMAGTRPTGFLQKPYRLETVLQTVEKFLN